MFFLDALGAIQRAGSDVTGYPQVGVRGSDPRVSRESGEVFGCPRTTTECDFHVVW